MRRQAITWSNAHALSIGPLWTHFSEIWIKIENFSFKKMRLNISSGKWWPFCLGLNVLITWTGLCGSQGYAPVHKANRSTALTWWRHQMETFSALLALCAGKSPVPVNSPHKGQWRGALIFSFNYAWINDWVNNLEAGDLRRQRVYYDVIVMQMKQRKYEITTQNEPPLSVAHNFLVKWTLDKFSYPC